MAYFHKLPDKISVVWKRDGKFIIGWVETGDNKFVTQAESASEFINIINDSILIIFEIPEKYHQILRKTKSFLPPEDQVKMLNDLSVPGAKIKFEKNEKVFSLA